MKLELDPRQPPEIAEAIALVIASGQNLPDPWWQAGVEEQLEP